MKRLFLLSFFFLPGFAVAQDSTRASGFSVENQLVMIQGNDFFSLVYTKNRQQFFAGPSVSNDWTFFGGLHAGYRILPWGMEKRFNWFFEYAASVQTRKSTFETKSAIEARYYGGVHTYRHRDVYYGGTVGGGCRLNVSKRFYFSASCDLLVFSGYKRNGAWTYWDGRPKRTFSYSASGFPEYFYDVGDLKLGIGYKFR